MRPNTRAQNKFVKGLIGSNVIIYAVPKGEIFQMYYLTILTLQALHSPTALFLCMNFEIIILFKRRKK